jgi:hypothetical protein
MIDEPNKDFGYPTLSKGGVHFLPGEVHRELYDFG